MINSDSDGMISPRYWASANTTMLSARGQIHNPPGVFCLAFSLGAIRETDMQGGFRLVVIASPSVKSHVIVDECPELRSIRPTHCVDTTSAFGPDRCFRDRRASWTNRSPLEPFTIILSLLEECGWIEEITGWQLSVLNVSHQGFTEHLYKTPPRVLFDRTYTRDVRGRGLSPTLHLRILDNVGSHLPQISSESFLWYHVYICIRQLKTFQPPIASLPRDIVLKITDFALQNLPSFSAAWNSTLLSVGLINRAWVVAFDVRWKRLGTDVDCLPYFHQYSSARASLEKGISTEAARYLKGFDFSRFTHHRGIRKALFAFASAFIKNSTCLNILNINSRIFQMSIDALANQENIESLEIASAKYEDPVPSLREFRNVVINWPRLRELELRLDRFRIQETTNDDSPPPSGLHWLEKLYIAYGRLTGNELTSFVPTSNQRLRSFALYGVTGVTNGDLWDFFSVSHSTLEHVSIHDTPVLPSVPLGHHSEYALDAWVSKMNRLTTATIPAEIASMNAIAEKWAPDLRPNSAGTLTPPKLKIDITFTNMPSDLLLRCGRDDTQAMNGDTSFLTAITRTGWDEVCIVLPSLPPVTERISNVFSVAEEKGLTLRIFGQDGSCIRAEDMKNRSERL